MTSPKFTDDYLKRLKEYRVVWQREGFSKKNRIFKKRESVDRWIKLLTSDKPWEAYGLEGDAAVCCSGMECGCGGMTNEQSFNKRKGELPKLLSVEIQERKVEAWRKASGK